MATSLSLYCNGKRFQARITPAQKLQALVEQVVSQLHPAPQLSDCSLLVNGKPADMSSSLRMANLPSNAKLEVITGQPTTLGIRALSSSGPSTSRATASVDQPPSEASKGMQQRSHPADPSQEGSYQLGAAAAVGPTLMEQPASLSSHGVDPIAGASALEQSKPSSSGASHQNGARDHPATQQPPAQPLPSKFAALGLDRETLVFTRADMEATSSATTAEDPPDDFFEFSAEDYARVMAGWSRAHKRAEAGLRTAKLREQEEREKASKFPAAIQRIHFPDGFIMQARFSSLDQVAAVKKTVRACLRPEIARRKWYLYISPPKQVLQDELATLYGAGLCPAANLYFGSDGNEGPFLRPEVADLRSAPPEQKTAPANGGDQQQGGTYRGTQHAADADELLGQRSRESQNAEGAKRVPKWMKLKK